MSGTPADAIGHENSGHERARTVREFVLIVLGSLVISVVLDPVLRADIWSHLR